MNDYKEYYAVFKDPEGRTLHTERVKDYGHKWGMAQIESLARLQSRDYSARCEITNPDSYYKATPVETKGMYDMADMGYALWCKPGGHAFDPDDKGRKRMSFTDYSGDQPEDVTAWACGKHAPNISSRTVKPVPEIAPAADQELYREFLEWRNGMRDEPLKEDDH